MTTLFSEVTTQWYFLKKHLQLTQGLFPLTPQLFLKNLQLMSGKELDFMVLLI
jgi:hypothetical protein